MVAKERATVIKQLLERNQKVSVSELSRALSVTEETIRRDLEKLEGQGFLKRTYGGAILHAPAVSTNTDFYQRSLRRTEEKRIVAANALPLIERAYAIAADSSTTAMEAVKLARHRSGLSVLTYSSAIQHEMVDSEVTVVSTGGVLDKGTLSFTGQAAKDALMRYHVDLALFSCKGLDLEGGVFDSREADADIKRCLFGRASKLVLLADHTKFNRTSFVRLSTFDRVDYIVTDRDPGSNWRALCQERGIELIF